MRIPWQRAGAYAAIATIATGAAAVAADILLPDAPRDAFVYEDQCTVHGSTRNVNELLFISCGGFL